MAKNPNGRLARQALAGVSEERATFPRSRPVSPTISLNFSARQARVHKLRPRLYPKLREALQERGLGWADVAPPLARRAAAGEEKALEAKCEQPREMLEALIGDDREVALKVELHEARAKLGPQLKAALAEHGLSWGDLRPVLATRFESLAQVEEACKEPLALLRELTAPGAPLFRQASIHRARLALEGCLAEQGATYDDALPELRRLDEDALRVALDDPGGTRGG